MFFPPSTHHHHQNLSKQHSSSRFSSSQESIIGLMSRFFKGGYDWLSSPILMAEDESRIESVMEDPSTSKDYVMMQDPKNDNNNNNNNINNNNNSNNEDWLQLSIGGHSSSQEKQDDKQKSRNDCSSSQEKQDQRHELVELNLLPGSSSSSDQREMVFSQRYHSVAATIPTQEFQMQSRPPWPVTHLGFDTSLFLQHNPGIITSSNFLPPHLLSQPLNNQETNWVYRPMNFPRPTHLGLGSSSSSPATSSSFIMPPEAYFSSARMPFELFQPGPAMIPSMSSTGLSNINFRVINPPRRPHSGIWFMLQASKNQAKEPFLPQIPKSYLRIKDGRMTIRLVTKYLVNKLRLENESEVEITCRGQQVVPLLTLQHVRDNIWNNQQLRNNNNNNNIVAMTTLLPESSTTDHIMVLHYARTSI